MTLPRNFYDAPARVAGEGWQPTAVSYSSEVSHE